MTPERFAAIVRSASRDRVARLAILDLLEEGEIEFLREPDWSGFPLFGAWTGAILIAAGHAAEGVKRLYARIRTPAPTAGNPGRMLHGTDRLPDGIWFGAAGRFSGIPSGLAFRLPLRDPDSGGPVRAGHVGVYLWWGRTAEDDIVYHWGRADGGLRRASGNAPPTACPGVQRPWSRTSPEFRVFASALEELERRTVRFLFDREVESWRGG